MFGDADEFYPNYEANDAWMVKSRGAYFLTSRFKLPPYGSESAVTLGAKWTVETWLRRKDNAQGSLLGKWTNDYGGTDSRINKFAFSIGHGDFLSLRMLFS